MIPGLLAFLLFSSLRAGAESVFRFQPVAETPGQRSMISILKGEIYVEDCGCSFGYPAKNNTSGFGSVLALSPDIKTAWINIDGQDVELKLARATSLKVARIGSRFRRTYVTRGISVLVIQTITRMCIPYSPNCEWTGYRATVVVNKDARLQRVNLEGQCGCM